MQNFKELADSVTDAVSKYRTSIDKVRKDNLRQKMEPEKLAEALFNARTDAHKGLEAHQTYVLDCLARDVDVSSDALKLTNSGAYRSDEDLDELEDGATEKPETQGTTALNTQAKDTGTGTK